MTSSSELPTEPEPSFELRTAALEVRRLFNSYRLAGFTESQSMQLVCTHIATNFGS